MGKIIICDENDGSREALKIILLDHFELILTNDPEQCFDTLENARDVKILIIDLKTVGLDLITSIKKKHPDIRILAIAGGKSADQIQGAKDAGITTYLLKPFQTQEVLAICKGK